jgi:hypothetical protein
MTLVLPWLHRKPLQASAWTGDMVVALTNSIQPLSGPAKVAHITTLAAQPAANGRRSAMPMKALPSQKPTVRAVLHCSAAALMLARGSRQGMAWLFALFPVRSACPNAVAAQERVWWR